MRHLIFSRSLAALLLALVFGLAACGSVSQPNSNGDNSGNAREEHTPSPNPGKVTAGKVKLVLDKSHYALNEVIPVTITNGLATPIYASAYYTNCTLVLLEWKSNDSWLARGRCQTSAAHVISLKPGSATQQQLSPTTGAFRPTTSNAWTPGTYRITFFYNATPDEQNLQGTPVYSETFTVG